MTMQHGQCDEMNEHESHGWYKDERGGRSYHWCRGIRRLGNGVDVLGTPVESPPIPGRYYKNCTFVPGAHVGHYWVEAHPSDHLLDFRHWCPGVTREELDAAWEASYPLRVEVEACPFAEEHQGHTWQRVEGAGVRKLWCEGVHDDPDLGERLASKVLHHSSGKPDLSRLSYPAMRAVADCMANSDFKYPPHNWRGGGSWTDFLNSGLRHAFDFLNGEDMNEETKSSHLANAVFNFMAVLDWSLRGVGTDDRWKNELRTPPWVGAEPVAEPVAATKLEFPMALFGKDFDDSGLNPNIQAILQWTRTPEGQDEMRRIVEKMTDAD